LRINLILPTHRPMRKPRFRSLAPPYNLAVVAGNTPGDVDVTITDQYIEPIQYDRHWDLVAITSVTANFAGACAVARRFRERGVPVVMGGVHATAMPEYALQFCDAVVAGEAEGVWPRLVSDFQAGCMERIYRNNTYPDLAGMAWARRDLWRRHRYIFTNFIETSRGCPFNCEYCSDHTVYGRRHRFRPVEEVVEEIRSIRRGDFFVFIDNNIVGNVERSKELFARLIPLRIRWVGQASITFAYDRELVELARRSGCLGVLVGLETLKGGVLKRIGKPLDPARYIENIKTLQDAGIFVQGEFIFGFDEDDPSVFAETLEFAQRAGLASARFAVLKPYPGTRLFERLRKEGRIGDPDWSDHRSRALKFEPKAMTRQELTEGRNRAYEEFFSWGSIAKRVGMRRKNWPLIWLVNLTTNLTKNSSSS